MRFALVMMGALMALGATASAQTVSSEVWAGPLPVDPPVGAVSRAQVLQELRAAQAQPQAAGELWVGSAHAAGVHVGQLSRAEVLADLALAQRAGLLASQGEGYDPDSAPARERYAAYRQMRDGVAYTRALQELQGRTEVLMAQPGQ